MENPAEFDKAMKKRQIKITAKKITALYNEKAKITTQIQELQSERNSLAKEIGGLRKSGQNADELMEKSKKINEKIGDLEDKISNDENDKLTKISITLPNLLDDVVPYGESENDNVEIRRFIEPIKFDFKPKQHFELGEEIEQMDFKQTVKISGARFTSLFGDLAKLERALSHFMLDIATEFGYTEVSLPYLTKANAMFGTGQLPKFGEDSFVTENGFWLIPTGEVPLTNMANDKIFEEKELPIRMTTYTPCFRSEAGSAGKDTRGMLRQHQFKKVELVSFTTEDKSEEEHERMTSIAEEVLKRLKIPFRTILKCSEDTGFTATKTYDLEAWLPGQNTYREISSCSNCKDFQARRMKGRYRPENGGKTKFIHTLNGSSLAVGRTIIAVMENYQQKDGSIQVPEILIPYMSGQKVINKK
jgi:seryl-tRNA synthetase